MIIRTALKKGQLILRYNNVLSAKLDSEILLSKAINKNKKFIILNLNKEIKTVSYTHLTLPTSYAV